MRRVAAFETSEEEVFHDGDLHVDRARFEVSLQGERVHLTKGGAALEAVQGAAATFAARLTRPSAASLAGRPR